MSQELSQAASVAKTRMIMTIAVMLLWALFSTAVSPSYLIEGLSNHALLNIDDKADYHALVSKIDIAYKAIWGLLIVLALWTKHQWVKLGAKV